MHCTQLSHAFQEAAHSASLDDTVAEVHYSASLKKVWLGRFLSLHRAAQAVALARQKFNQQVAINAGDLAKAKFAAELDLITDDLLEKSSVNNTGFLGVKKEEQRSEKEASRQKKKRRVHDFLGCDLCTHAHDCSLNSITMGSIALPTYSIIQAHTIFHISIPLLSA